MMATSQRDASFVHVYAANEDTIVHIRQLIYTDSDQTTPTESRDGVVMTLMQFRSLMFHLRALDAQFMQGSEIQLPTSHDEEHQSHDNSTRIGEKRTWIEMNNDDDDVLETNPTTDKIVKQYGDEQTDNTTIAWKELDNVLSTLSPTVAKNGMKIEPELPNTQKSVMYIPKPIMSQKSVRDELAIAYAEEIITLIPSLVYDACNGCKKGLDRNINTQQHDVCMLPRRKRIELFAEMAVLLVGSQSIQDKVTARLKCRHAVFNEKWIHEDGQSLITSKRWMRKLKTHMLDM